MGFTFAALFADIGKIEQTLNLPKGFIEGLMKDDDWSFIIRSHAVIETMITQMLVAKTSEKLSKTFERMQLSGGPVSKLNIAKDLELIDTNIIEVIRYFSKIRNSFVHSAKNLQASLLEYIKEDGDPEYSTISAKIARLISESPDNELIALIREQFRDSPKAVLGIVTLYILGTALFHIDPKERKVAENQTFVGVAILIFFLLVEIMKSDKEN